MPTVWEALLYCESQSVALSTCSLIESSPLSSSGCVVYGRVSGDSAASFLLQNQKASNRLGAVAGHLLETKVKIDPSSSKVHLEFSWAGEGGSTTTPVAPSPGPAAAAPSSSPAPAAAAPSSPPKEEAKPTKSGEYTSEEVAKHNTKDDIWVVVEGQVLDVTKFLPEHPGGEKAILLYGGKDATEEFLMLHDPKASSSSRSMFPLLTWSCV